MKKMKIIVIFRWNTKKNTHTMHDDNKIQAHKKTSKQEANQKGMKNLKN
jgi:hypothetical protein